MPAGLLPPGFVAIDLAKALGLPLHDPDNKNARRRRRHLSQARQRPDRQRRRPSPTVVVAANGGSDLVYLPGKDRTLAAR